MKKSGDQHTNGIARLRGTRFVTTTEVEEGRKISEPLKKNDHRKRQAGGTVFVWRVFEFIPTFKIFMPTNHKPVINNPALKDDVVV
jgi:putative DNA primase/helicase